MIVTVEKNVIVYLDGIKNGLMLLNWLLADLHVSPYSVRRLNFYQTESEAFNSTITTIIYANNNILSTF